MHAPVFVGRFTGALGDQHMLPKRVRVCVCVGECGVWHSRVGRGVGGPRFFFIFELSLHSKRTQRARLEKAT